MCKLTKTDDWLIHRHIYVCAVMQALVPTGAHELFARLKTSVPLFNLKKMLTKAFKTMEQDKIPRPASGYTSEQLRQFLKKHNIFLPEMHIKDFSDSCPEASPNPLSDIRTEDTTGRIGSLFQPLQLIPSLLVLVSRKLFILNEQVAVTYMWLGIPLLELVELLIKHYGGKTMVWLDIVFNDQRNEMATVQVCVWGGSVSSKNCCFYACLPKKPLVKELCWGTLTGCAWCTKDLHGCWEACYYFH